jgi:hypothetical protein
VTLAAVIRSLILRLAFCSQGEHKRETIDASSGGWEYRCLDCGRKRELGAVFVGMSNKKVRP